MTTETYLDANAIGHLVPKGETRLALRRRDALLEATRSGRVHVLTSVALLQELLAIGAVNWDAHLRVVGFLREVAVPQVLLDTRDLARAEVRLGRKLVGVERFLDADTSERLWAEVLKRETVAEVTAAAKEEAARFVSDDRVRRDETMRKLDSVTPPGESVPKNVRRWWDDDPRRHVREFALITAQSIGSVAEGYPVEELPALWRFHAYMTARISRVHGARHEIKPTDLADAHHYAASAYADVFVSGDGPLRVILAAIPDAQLPVSLEDFCRDVLGCP